MAPTTGILQDGVHGRQDDRFLPITESEAILEQQRQLTIYSLVTDA